MPEKWTGAIVGRMHVNRITCSALAAELGCTKAYISMVLNGHRNPKNAEQTFRQALDKLIREKRSRITIYTREGR